jgi:hypothetical protein
MSFPLYQSSGVELDYGDTRRGADERQLSATLSPQNLFWENLTQRPISPSLSSVWNITPGYLRLDLPDHGTAFHPIMQEQLVNADFRQSQDFPTPLNQDSSTPLDHEFPQDGSYHHTK